MLIPPSVLMIVWGILTEQSIGALFLAGVVPGLLVAGMLCLYILGTAILRPETVGAGRAAPPGDAGEAVDPRSRWLSTLALVLVVVAVLGGIWFGFFTPTEGAGAGAFIALVLGILKGMRWR
ncbi:MAG: TRAP transporter large permease subunit, partial [Geminicoccales bacterium]